MPYIRRDKHKLADGTERTYASIAHNITEPGPDGKRRAKPVVMANLGPETELDEKTVDGLIAAFQRYKKKRFGSPEDVRETAAETRQVEAGLRILASRAFGVRVVIEQVWKELGLDRVLRQVARGRRVGFDLERITFGMVLHRLVDPGSKLACNDFLRQEAWFPEGSAWEVHQFYRALDVLEQHADVLSDAVAQALASPEELRCLLIDTTTTYFETDVADEATADEPVPTRKRGHSKDHRGDKPQVVIGLVTDALGRPLDHIVSPGNTSDQRLTVELAMAARQRVPDGRIVAVCDAGMGSARNLAAMDDEGLDRISGVPLRVLKAADKLILAKAGRWAAHPSKPDVTWRHVVLDAKASPSERAEVWVATRNRKARRQQLASVDRDVNKVRAALREGDHSKAVCAVVASSRLKRFVKPGKVREWVLDHDRIRVERRRCGVKLIRSTLVDLPPLRSLHLYEGQYAVEHAFRALKGPIKLRPVYHRRADRIRAHVLVCMLALTVMRTLETRVGMSFSQLIKLLRGVRATQVERDGQAEWHRGEWSAEAKRVLAALAIEEGPTVLEG